MKFRTLGQLAATLVNRSRFAGLAGVTFDGTRDLYKAFGYQRVLTVQDFRARFLRNGMAARIVSVKPEDTWRGGATLQEDPNPEVTTPFEEEFELLNHRLKVWSRLQAADILAGIGQYAIILIGAPGALDTPLERASAADIKYLACYGQDDASVAEFDINEQSPRYGRPLYYDVKRSSARSSTATRVPAIGKRVHWSRVIHIVDGLLDDPVYGTPRLEKVWNLLDDLEKVTGGGAEAFFRRADGGTQFNLDPTMDLDADAKAAMQEEVDKFVHGFSRVLRTRGLEVNRLGSDVAGIKDPADAITSQICASIGVPQRVLMGSEQGKLAAEQDSVKYYRGIEARRADVAAPQMVRPLIDRFIELGVLSTPAQYEVTWSQLKTADDAEKMDMAKAASQVNATQGETVITTNEIRTKFLGWEAIEEINVEPRIAGRKEGPSWQHVHRAADRFPRSAQARGLQRVPSGPQRDGSRGTATGTGRA